MHAPKTARTILRGGLPALLLLTLAAAARADEALSLVPSEAASVGMVRLDELRNSPLAAKLLADMDRMTGDGDAARFLEETGLRPKEDVDTVVVAAIPRAGSRGRTAGLVLFEGRFDPVRLAGALSGRGASRRASPEGEYYLLAGEHHNGDPGAIAFVSRRLIVAGSEDLVRDALAARRASGSGFLRGEGLGKHFTRLPADASAWALVDAVRYPIARGARNESDRGGDPSRALAGAMKSVSLFAFAATAREDALELTAIGLSDNDDTRDDLEDALRGVIAMWRMAAQEKSPELVSVLRRFEVDQDREGVTVSGTLPGSMIRLLTAHREAKRRQR